jgi:hypothetical protein
VSDLFFFCFLRLFSFTCLSNLEPCLLSPFLIFHFAVSVALDCTILPFYPFDSFFQCRPWAFCFLVLLLFSSFKALTRVTFSSCFAISNLLPNPLDSSFLRFFLSRVVFISLILLSSTRRYEILTCLCLGLWTKLRPVYFLPEIGAPMNAASSSKGRSGDRLSSASGTLESHWHLIIMGLTIFWILNAFMSYCST